MKFWNYDYNILTFVNSFSLGVDAKFGVNVVIDINEFFIEHRSKLNIKRWNMWWNCCIVTIWMIITFWTHSMLHVALWFSIMLTHHCFATLSHLLHLSCWSLTHSMYLAIYPWMSFHKSLILSIVVYSVGTQSRTIQSFQTESKVKTWIETTKARNKISFRGFIRIWDFFLKGRQKVKEG